MTRLHNFCAGPCTLPVSVLEQLRDDMVDFKGSGMSLIEMSHRSAVYDEVHHATMSALKRLYAVPDDFEILLLQGGASLQFAMAPLNLLHEGDKAAYIVSGTWGTKAYEDATVCGDAYVAWSGYDNDFTAMPTPDELELRDNTRYLHITSNETIGGIRLPEFADYGVRQVADMSSDYLSRPIPWEYYDIVYGGAQKNLGPAGLAVVFVRKSVLEVARKDRPSPEELHGNLAHSVAPNSRLATTFHRCTNLRYTFESLCPRSGRACKSRRSASAQLCTWSHLGSRVPSSLESPAR